jgi:hypothetical protein
MCVNVARRSGSGQQPDAAPREPTALRAEPTVEYGPSPATGTASDARLPVSNRRQVLSLLKGGRAMQRGLPAADVRLGYAAKENTPGKFIAGSGTL